MAKATRTKSKPLPKGLDRLSSGNIRVRVLNADGVQVTVGTYADVKAALAALAAAKTDIDRGDWIDPSRGKILFSDLAEQVRQHRVHDLAPRTQQENVYLLNKLLPTFGHLPVNKISVRHVDVWWSQYADHPVQRRNAYFLMSSIFKYAIRWGYVKQTPCMVEKAGRDVSAPRPVHSVVEFEAVVAHLEPDLQRAMRVMFAAHLRISEVCGLNWSDWNSKSGKLSALRQADRNRTGETAPTKTRFTKTVTLLQMGADALQEHQQAHPGIGATPIFRGPLGGRLRAAYLLKKWNQAADVAGIENFHPHDVRHVSLTLVGRTTKSIATVMERGGHTTKDAALRYQSTSADADVAAAKAADEELLRQLG